MSRFRHISDILTHFDINYERFGHVVTPFSSLKTVILTVKRGQKRQNACQPSDNCEDQTRLLAFLKNRVFLSKSDEILEEHSRKSNREFYNNLRQFGDISALLETFLHFWRHFCTFGVITGLLRVLESLRVYYGS